MTELKDGGTRTVYSTGAQKEDSSKTVGKGAYHLLPPHPIRRVAEIYRRGALKYSEYNWSRGLPLSRLVDSGLRHFFQFLEGLEDEDHLHQSLWCLLAISHTMEQIRRGELPEELNDLPSYGKGTIQVHETLTCDKWREDRRFGQTKSPGAEGEVGEEGTGTDDDDNPGIRDVSISYDTTYYYCEYPGSCPFRNSDGTCEGNKTFGNRDCFYQAKSRPE